MELPHKRLRSSSTTLLLVTIIVVGVFLLSFFSVQTANEQNHRSLEDRASTIATALDTDKIAKLTGKSTDLNLPEYKSLKYQLTALRQINSDARTIYLMGAKGDTIFFYVDSEQPESAYYSPPGQTYPEATDTLKNIFYSSPQPIVKGPVKDKFGTWITGLAPIFNPHTGRVMAVIGLDVDTVDYNQELLGSLAVPLGGGLVLLVIVGIYEISRRHDQQMMRLRSELISIASHELRSPLVGIRWAVEGMLKSPNNKAEEQKLKAIMDSITHLQAGTEDILQFTALTNSNQKPTYTPTNMTELVKEICDTQRLVAQQKNVQLVIDDSWPKSLTITCDTSRMKRALHNVVSNAIKYTRSNTSVTISYKHTDKYHQIVVSDQGIGIPKLEQKRVLSGFYRASNAKATGVEGTGLGLYLTRTIMEQHHGSIWFTSEEGKGTTFVLSLPLRKH